MSRNKSGDLLMVVRLDVKKVGICCIILCTFQCSNISQYEKW